MYKFHPPAPIIINLSGQEGLDLREKASKFVKENFVKGAEKGNSEEQGFGVLAEVVLRHYLRLPYKNTDDPLGYDILLESGIKIDIKCRGGTLPFKEVYISDDGVPREAKHNFFARQLYDDKLDTDIYLMTHLETPSVRALPGTKRQKKWKLYICGWVSKTRVIREGVFLPRGSLTEQGRSWFTYRGQEIEFYNKNLNGLEKLEDILLINKEDFKVDENKKGDLNLTTVDALRIAYDLVGRGILKQNHIEYIKKELNITQHVKSILHSNQYFHLLKWLDENQQLKNGELERIEKIMKKEKFEKI